jgi:Fe2+ transport system protein FeoA
MKGTLLKTLTHAVSGETVVFRSVQGAPGLLAHLAALGLLPGVKVHVYRNDRTGPVVIGVHGSRVMLGREIAEKANVQKLERAG